MRAELKAFDSRRIEDDRMFDPGKSMYIEASAGTGKTYTIQQMVARLIKEGTEVSRILLVTYTEKAAGELKTRIREKIEEVLATNKLIKDVEKEITGEEKKKFETALSEADNLQVFTIHSFCQKMLRTHAYEASRPFEMELIDDSQVKTLISRWVREKWPELPEYRELFLIADGESSEGSNEAKVIENIETLLANAVSKFYLDKEGKVDENVISWDEEEIKMPGEPEKVEPLTEDEEKLSTIDLGSFDGRKKSEEFVQIYNDLKKLRDCGTVTDTKENERLNKLIACLENGEKYGSTVQNRWIKNVEFKQIFEKLQQFESAVTQAKKVKEKQLLAKSNQFLHEQTEALYRAWGKEKVGNKVESYQDMIAAVHHAVMERDSELCKKLREMYQYAIIDEFQDTNQLQWDIFRTVFFGDADGKRVKEHSIFVVGDPKQSIYSFQGADVNVYRNAVREIGNGRCLGTNYRSTPSVIKACNALFSGDFFGETDIEGGEREDQDASGNGIRFEPSDWPGRKENNSQKDKVCAQFDGQDVSSIWLAKSGTGTDGDDEGSVNEKEFAATAVEQIILCCSQDVANPGNTRLRVFDGKDSQKRRNVKFSDFAVLARTRTEFIEIEKSLKKYGVPFVRYKDNKLFAGRECMAWMAMFKAIDAEDFSANNRRILNEVLLTDFFDCRGVLGEDVKRCKLEVLDADYFDDPLCDERVMIGQWHRLASNGRWAELQESIYRESGIERRLSDLSKLQEIAKLHQIGNYCVEYLYKERCGIEDLVKHLERLSEKDEGTNDQDGNLVERGSDFDAVQLMTIHASKGLEFPVVIGVGGYKGINNNVKGPFLYHEQVDGEARLKLGFDKLAKKRRQKEEIEEWKRLFYVAYTRASSIMILPQYPKWTGWQKEPLNFLKQGIGNIGADEIKEIRKLKKDDELRGLVVDILKKEKEEKDIEKKEKVESGSEREEQNKRIAELQRGVGRHCLIQHSYSSLAKKVKKADVAIIPEETKVMIGEDGDSSRYGEEADEDGQSETKSNIDVSSKQVMHKNDYQEERVEFEADYPRGTQLGNAIHKIFEKSDFERFGSNKDNPDLIELTEKSFKRHGFNTEEHESWVARTTSMVFETLNAKLPEIHGGRGTGVPFRLKELGKEAHFAEVEFMLSGNMEEKGEKKETKCKEGAYFSKGYIDLLFVRPDKDGNARYSILDWKTDNLECQTYSDPKKLKEKVDMNYAVQRVLYSYNLIQWLKQFYEGKSEKEIFEAYFGGIYYVFVRGCRAETANGIYAQTWESYEQLEESYQSVKELMFSSKPNEEDKEQK